VTSIFNIKTITGVYWDTCAAMIAHIEDASLTVAGLESISDAVDSVNSYLGKDAKASRPGSDSVGTGERWWDELAELAESKDKASFRDYANALEHVKVFYHEQHARQTVDFNLRARKKYLGKTHARMTVWQAMEKLNQLVDESDPDTSLSQIQHLLQTAEAIRKDGKPDWMQLTGLVHDLGKLLCFFGADGQWDVVGDTFIVGARFPESCIYPETFGANPDSDDKRYNTELGMYARGCGLDNVMFSWGHDEYLYWRLKKQSKLPQAGLDMIRLHSCYPLHREGAYRQFFAPGDEAKIKNVLEFNVYDLYSKSDKPPEPTKLRPYYEELIDKYIIGGKDALLEW